MSDPVNHRGPLAWMAKNPVAANLLMVLLLLGGWVLGSGLKREVFPEIPEDAVRVTASYPGADPSQVERAVLEPMEQALRSLEVTREIRAYASEGFVWMYVRFVEGVSAERGLDEVERAIGRIDTFPDALERPRVQIPSERSEAITVMLHGPGAELEGLKRLTEQVMSELEQLPQLTLVTAGGVRAPEVHVEVDPARIEELGLTRADIARAISSGVRAQPGGSLETTAGEVLVRVGEEREDGASIADIPVLTRPDAAVVRVGDVATVVDGFADGVRRAYFNGERAVRLDVYRVGDERPLEIAAAVKDYVARRKGTMPVGYEISIWDDETEEFGARIDLLTRNASTGLLLVLIVLGIFLSIRLSFWVTLGIPISFLGAMWFVPLFDVSINMISLFGFIIVLGIVVDDAIVVGEAIYAKRSEHSSPLDAAIAGVREVGAPVVFSVLTTVVAFSPLLFVPEQEGKFFRSIPIIVI
ncbi:MAG: efflux RND transporter permease subunit, partial [Myxococcota bacterium]